jgi:hypothetical protein
MQGSGPWNKSSNESETTSHVGHIRSDDNRSAVQFPTLHKEFFRSRFHTRASRITEGGVQWGSFFYVAFGFSEDGEQRPSLINVVIQKMLEGVDYGL